MAEAYVSVTENALENQRIGTLQIGVVAICMLIQMCDGYDVGSIGWAVPSLTHVWNLPPPAFSTAFVWSSVGVMVGALAAGPIGDRFGRKPLLLASVAIFGLASLLSAVRRLARRAERVALLHRARHRRRHFRERQR